MALRLGGGGAAAIFDSVGDTQASWAPTKKAPYIAEPAPFALCPNLPKIAQERGVLSATRAALYSRHTPHEWLQNNMRNYHEADSTRNLAERLRSEAVRVMREAQELTSSAQRDSGRRLGERISDTTFWQHEVSAELEKLLAESSLLAETRRSLDKAAKDCDGPLHVAQECLYHRENRQGIDLVHDQVEIALLSEVDTLKSCQSRLRALHDRATGQLRSNRAAQHELERDLRHKESALDIDSKCHGLSNHSKEINFYSGIEKVDPTVSVPETWAQFSSRNVQRSAAERASSRQLRSEADLLISTCSSEMWDAWNRSNNNLAKRSSEVMDTKSKLEMHLHKVQQEIFDVERNMSQLRRAISDKCAPMRVAQTRLEARIHRPDVELCRDPVQHRLVKEVHEIESSVERLQRKLAEAEAQHQQLLRTKAALQADLQVKSNSLFIDRERCLGMRRGYPLGSSVKY
ncbi:tektin-3-like [Cloeon dipterum]|uniref:tektin-3-like n=1 Tax=Cloeon dipterum TaxID=197152 RepID=UPI00321F6232